MTTQAQVPGVPRRGVPDDDALSESSLTSGSAASELDMLLEFTDALAADIPALRSPDAAGVFAFSLADAQQQPARSQRKAGKAVGAVDAKREKSREKERRKYYRKKVRRVRGRVGSVKG